MEAREVDQLVNALATFNRGDFSVRLPATWSGASGRVADYFNEIIESNHRLNEELNKVKREVGKEGKVTKRIVLPDAAGDWYTLSSNVNELIDDLVRPTSEINRVIGAVAKGDLGEEVELEIEGRKLQGEYLRTARTINTMVHQLSSFASEVTRVAREVGMDGKLGGQAKVKGVAGTWKDLTDSVNMMANNLTSQVRNIAEVTKAVAKGDLSKKVTVDVKGEILELKDTVNTMVDQLGSFSSEVTRVAREVGSDGQLGGQANVRGVSGTWKDLTESVNMLANNLTSQVRNIADVTTAVAKGDMSRKITVAAKGEVLQLKETINTMVDQLSSFSREVNRVAREVGTDGKLGGQANVPGVSGTWKDLTDNVNVMAGNLTSQVRSIADVTTAVAKGDLSRKITVDARGEVQELKETINTMVDQLSRFASEVTRVATEVGTDGKLGGQANVREVSGTWKDLTDSVNVMANNLTIQVRNIAEVTTAVAKGDLSRKITVDASGEVQELKDTINVMVDQLRSFSSEVTRVAREVGIEGKLGGQATVTGVSGTWKDLTDNVNMLAANLTGQVRNIAAVTTAVANGDLSRKITVDVEGEILELKITINTMVDQLRSFASEVTRVAREVGTEGKLGGQATVTGVSGTWKDLTDNVNLLAANLTGQVRNIAEVTTAVANGDLSRKISVDASGEVLELKSTINTMVDQLRSFSSEVTRVAREVGTEGKLGGQANVQGVSGTWKDLTDNVNMLAGNLTGQVRNIAAVTTAVANGDLSRKITVDVKGEILELKDTINTMVDQLRSFASEVTRVAREVGVHGRLGGQANVQGVSGTWKDLTDSVNMLAANLTGQVRNIAAVTTAVANGDLSRKITVDVEGEVQELKDTINNMVDQLRSFSSEVTRVAREVGTEGKLGGQAYVSGVSGTWKDLTDNVNQLALSLTTQLRAIATVSTAVTEGDLTRTINVDAAGEVAELKNYINQMILNLRETSLKNMEQDWLKTNLTTFTRMLQGQRDLLEVARLVLSELAPVVQAQHGLFYILDDNSEDEAVLKLLSSYAYSHRKHLANEFKLGETVIGQTALEKKKILLTNVPEQFLEIQTGLGHAGPSNIIVLPVLFETELKAVVELASFEKFTDTHLSLLDQLMDSLGIVIHTIQANMRTEQLLKQSQTLAMELQTQQGELQQTNVELEEKARELAEQNAEVERKNREVELAKEELEEKAEQLALTSRYKSEFLANMSHELRTPLNSLLILSRQLSDNPDGNLSQRQVEYASTINSAGSDLLSLINDILDLSKIESGTVSLDLAEQTFDSIRDFVERTFRHVGEQKNLPFVIHTDPNLPSTIFTDSKRLQQVLKNLLANSFKFTESGQVTLQIETAREGFSPHHPVLSHAETVVAFMVKDTGIGIPLDKQRIIFEAFQQAEGSTNRKYGGTGLGLSISREIAWLLGGEIRLHSTPGQGSEFILYLPLHYVGSADFSPEIVPLEHLETAVESEPETVKKPRKSKAKAASTQLRTAYTPSTRSEYLRQVGVEVVDDRNAIQSGDCVMLIIEDDASFSKVLLEMAREHDFKALVANRGDSGIALTHGFHPDAITLDIHLPDIDGWTILERLKADFATRHIPVIIITVDEDKVRGIKRGAHAVLTKPVSKELIDQAFSHVGHFMCSNERSLLIVEDDEKQRSAIVDLVGGEDVTLKDVGSLEEALEAIREKRYDCIILDLLLPGTKRFESIEQIQQEPNVTDVPIIVYTGKDLTRDEETQLNKLANSVIIKDVRSPERLLYETTLFLHRPLSSLPENKRKMLDRLHDPAMVLKGKRVLVVDDDSRNTFALSSLLERNKMQVMTAEDGMTAIEMLERQPDVDVVLMDIMMPEMDGYETTRRIRSMAAFKTLPIIAVTAKAMRGDREKCIEAGASDYITKPVDSEQLLTLLRMWLHR